MPSTWPPTYLVRHSTKAQRMRLRILPGRGLELVLPAGMAEVQAQPFLEQHKDWIVHNLRKIEQQTNSTELPNSLSFWGGERKHTILHITGVSRATVRMHQETILIEQPKNDQAKAYKQLQQWWREQARQELAAYLRELCLQHGFVVEHIRSSPMRSRWGSCSVTGKVSLNSYLLFLPRSLVRHVLLHELCHTRHMNHSEKFWKELFALEPDALQLDKNLHRTGWSYVPAWVWL